MIRRISLTVAGLAGMVLTVFLIRDPERLPSSEARPPDLKPATPAQEMESQGGRASSAASATAGLGPTVDERIEAILGDCSWQTIEAAYAERFQEESLSAQAEEISRRLASAEDARLILASAMIGGEGRADSDDERMRRALAMAPADPLILWQAASFCEPVEQTAAYCDDPARIGTSNEVLEENGAYWVIMAGARYVRNDRDGALRYLERGVTAPRFDIYFAEQLVLLERALAAAGNLPYRLRVAEALGVLAAQPSAFGLVNACRVESPGDDGWLRACKAYANRLAREGETLMAQAMGRGMRRMLYESALAAPADQSPREKTAEELIDGGILQSKLNLLVTQWMLVDDGFAAAWVDTLIVKGEGAAFNQAIREAVRRGEELGLNPCSYDGIDTALTR
jgi:hypothetical protein